MTTLRDQTAAVGCSASPQHPPRLELSIFLIAVGTVPSHNPDGADQLPPISVARPADSASSRKVIVLEFCFAPA